MKTNNLNVQIELNFLVLWKKNSYKNMIKQIKITLLKNVVDHFPEANVAFKLSSAVK